MGNPYDNFLLETATPITSADGAQNFQWGTGSMKTHGVIDLVGIKTRNTGTGTIEIHVVDGASGYKSFQTHTGTPIPLQESSNYACWAAGDFSVDGPSVIGVKTANTASGKVEVHILTAASTYQNLSILPTVIDAADGAANYKWAYLPGGAELTLPALLGIKLRSTAKSGVEVHVLDGSKDFQSSVVEVSSEIDLADGPNYEWVANGNFNDPGYLPDLFCIKTRNTSIGKVEVNVLWGTSLYQQSKLFARTPIDASDGANNFHWTVDWFNLDPTPDLIGIKTSNTGSGFVELHVLSGTASEPASCATLRQKANALRGQIAAEQDLLTGNPRQDAGILRLIARLQAQLNGVLAQEKALGCNP